MIAPPEEAVEPNTGADGVRSIHLPLHAPRPPLGLCPGLTNTPTHRAVNTGILRTNTGMVPVTLCTLGRKFALVLPLTVIMLSKRALYLQVWDALAERITSGAWKPGTAVPNESDLAREFGVSLGTMRKALELMEARRLVTRR